jgi:hypothetical protein
MWSWLCFLNHFGAASRSINAMRTSYLVESQSCACQLLWKHPKPICMQIPTEAGDLNSCRSGLVRMCCTSPS